MRLIITDKHRFCNHKTDNLSKMSLETDLLKKLNVKCDHKTDTLYKMIHVHFVEPLI